MATQGQIRARAKSAVRATRAVYRRADSAGEKLERELDRLIKRKQLIAPEDVLTAAKDAAEYIQLAVALIKALQDLVVILGGNTAMLPTNLLKN